MPGAIAAARYLPDAAYASAAAPTVDDLVYDMWGAPYRDDGGKQWGALGTYLGKHEAPMGVSGTKWSWLGGATPGVYPPFPATDPSTGITYDYHNVWGMVVAVKGSTNPHGLRLYIEPPQVYHLQAGAASWSKVKGTMADNGGFQGNFYTGSSFSKSLTLAQGTHFRNESNGWSVDLNYMLNANGTIDDNRAILHFFWKGYYPRLQIPTGGRVAIHSRMKLFSDNAAVDPAKGQFEGHMSGDVFATATTTVGPGGKNRGFSSPRHRLIRPTFGHTGYVTATSESDLRGLLAKAPLPYTS